MVARAYVIITASFIHVISPGSVFVCPEPEGEKPMPVVGTLQLVVRHRVGLFACVKSL